METNQAHHYLLNEGVRIAHFFDHYDLKSGGCTVAYRPHTDKSSNRMVECAVTFCHPGEVFTKKIGTAIALERMAYGQVVDLPIGHPDDIIIHNHLRVCFGRLV